MNICKNVFYTSMTVMGVAFFMLFSVQTYQKYHDQRRLKEYYAGKLTEIYTRGYKLNRDGELAWTQDRFEEAIKGMEDQMLKENFNREQIERMKDKACENGQATRKFWDEYQEKHKSKKGPDGS